MLQTYSYPLKNTATPKADKTYVLGQISLFHEINKNINFKDKYNIVKSKQKSSADFAFNYNNLLSYNDVKYIFYVLFLYKINQ